MTSPEPLLDVALDLGEGPIWDDSRQRLLCVDINRGQVHEFDPVLGSDRVHDVGKPVGAVALTRRGDWLLAVGTGFSRLDPDTGRITALLDLAPDRDDLRMNDGYVDPMGRFWAGTMSLRHEADRGTLYRLDPDGQVQTMLSPVTTSNGIDWSPDGRTMYYVDTRTGRIDQFEFEMESGLIHGRRPFASVEPKDGRPDGLIVDRDGGVWVGLWTGGALRRYRPDGAVERTIRLPVSLVTKCAFGGADLGDLYVTTARADLSPAQKAAQPLAGHLFRLRPGVFGRPPARFAG